MIEIGKNKIVHVKRRVVKAGKPSFFTVIDTATGKPETKAVSEQIWRVCRNPLGGQFGKHKRLKLVAGLVAIDQLVLYPFGTRQEVRLNLADIYLWGLRSIAQRAQLETARQRKLKKQAARIRRRIADADRKLKKQLKKEREL